MLAGVVAELVIREGRSRHHVSSHRISLCLRDRSRCRPAAGAADQDISFRRWVERIGLIVDVARDESALAVVADAAAARPAHGHVAGFGQFEQAWRTDGRQRTVRPLRAKDTRALYPARRRHDAAAPAVKPRCRASAEGPAPNDSEWMRRGATPHARRPVVRSPRKLGRPAEIEVAVSRDTELLGAALDPDAGASKSTPGRSLGIGRAVPDMAVLVRQALPRSSRASAANGCSRPLRAPCSHQTSRGEASAASACSIASTGVAPIPALSKTTRPVARLQGEAAPRRADVEDVAGLNARRAR